MTSGLGRIPASAASEKGGGIGASAWDWAIKLVMLLVLTQFGIRLPDTATLYPHHMLLLCRHGGNFDDPRGSGVRRCLMITQVAYSLREHFVVGGIG